MRTEYCLLDKLAKVAIERSNWAFIERNMSSIDWWTLSRDVRLPILRLPQVAGDLDWCWVSSSYGLSVDEIREFSAYVDWSELTYSTRWTSDMIHEFSDRLDWGALSVHQVFSPEIYDVYADRFHWDSLAMVFSQWPDDFMTKFSHRISPNVLNAVLTPAEARAHEN